MTIQMTFNSFDDMKENILRIADALAPDAFTNLPEKEDAPAEEPAAEPTAEPAEEPAPMPEPVKEEPKISRTDMRKILSALNKSTGENTARKLISEMGYKALTDVPDDKLPELKAKAEEVLNAV